MNGPIPVTLKGDPLQWTGIQDRADRRRKADTYPLFTLHMIVGIGVSADIGPYPSYLP